MNVQPDLILGMHIQFERPNKQTNGEVMCILWVQMQVVRVPEDNKRREKGGVKAHQPLGGDKETNALSEKQLVSSAQIYFILLK